MQPHSLSLKSSMANRYITLLCLTLLTLLLSFLATSQSSYDDEEETPITRFQQYLRFNTAHPNPNYTAPVSFLSSIAQSMGLKIQTFEFVPNKPVLLVTWPGSKPSLPSILFNSHLDSVPVEPAKWTHPPFAAVRTSDGKIFARGAQDDKCIAIQYLEAIRILKAKNFIPTRTIHISCVPDEEVGGADGAGKFVNSKVFRDLNVGFAMDEGQASVNDDFRVFYADRSPWNLIIRAKGQPGHGSKMYDNSAMENLMKSVEVISKFRESQFDIVKTGKAANSEVISVNPVYLKAGIPSPTGFVMNMQPSEAEAGYNIRLTPTTDPDLFRKKIAEEWAPAVRNMTYEVMARRIALDGLITFNYLPAISPKRWNLASPKLLSSLDECINCIVDCGSFLNELIIQLGPIRDNNGRPLITAVDKSNPWWLVLKQAITAAGGKLAKPEILASTTDARFIRQLGIPALGFSPMANTPILLHEHNEFLKDTVFLKGIKVYEHVISSFSSFEEAHSI